MRSHDQSKRFTFITAPQHPTKELVQLDGVEFQGNRIDVEEANSRRKSNVLYKLHSRPHVVNSSSKNESTFSRNNFFSGDVTYADAANSVKRSLTRQNCIVISDSISCNIQIRDFSRKDESLPWCRFEKISTLGYTYIRRCNFDVAILHDLREQSVTK